MAFEFPPYRLDVAQGILLRAGERVLLVPKAVELLSRLVKSAGEVVQRQELMDALWPDVAVEEGNLAKLVFQLRKELGESAIETVPRRGYRFALAVTEDRPAEAVAVLPFSDLSDGRSEGALCEAVSEEFLNALSRLPRLRVVSRTSSFRFGGGAADVKEIGKQLAATLIVEGSVRKDAGRLRIAARLCDAESGYQRWSEAIDAPAGDVSSLQRSIASAVARGLSREAPQPSPRPVSLEAYELYSQGRYHWNRRPGEVVWQALRCFEKAIELEPGFAAAWAGLADVYATLGSWENSVLEPDDAEARATRFASRALQIDPALAEAHTTLAYTLLHHGFDCAAAAQRFRHALAQNPSYAPAHHWLSHALVADRRFDESLAASRAALALDPMNLLMSVHLSWHHHMAREPALALEQSERVLKMDANYHWGHYFAGWGLEALGRTSEAVEAMRRAVKCSADNPVMAAGLCRALAAAGDRAGAHTLLRELDRQRAGKRLLAFEEALVHLALGDRDAAFAALERAKSDRSGWMAYLDVEPRLDALRGDPRFEALR